jgi:hypothetical protein
MLLDPRRLNPVRVGAGAVQWAFARKVLPLSAVSPLDHLLRVEVPESAKTSADLVAIGVGLDPDGGVRTSSKGKIYEQALRVLARPEALLNFAEFIPNGKETLALHFILGDGIATLFELEDGGVSFSPALPFSDLLKSLSRHLANTEAPFEKLALWPSQLRMLGWLFAENKPSITAEFAQNRLLAAKLTEAEAKGMLDELVEAALVLREGSQLSPATKVKPVLERLATGCVAELTVVPYDKNGAPRPPTAVRFIGNEKDRLTSLPIEGEALKKAAPDSSEPVLISVTAEGKQELYKLLSAFVS